MLFIEEILDEDAKNYHAWGHRQWMLRKYNLWSDELKFVDRSATYVGIDLRVGTSCSLVAG